MSLSKFGHALTSDTTSEGHHIRHVYNSLQQLRKSILEQIHLLELKITEQDTKIEHLHHLCESHISEHEAKKINLKREKNLGK